MFAPYENCCFAYRFDVSRGVRHRTARFGPATKRPGCTCGAGNIALGADAQFCRPR
jgi:hypothetical protein